MDLEKFFYIEDINKKARYLMGEYGNKDEMIRAVEDAHYNGFQYVLDILKGEIIVKNGKDKTYNYNKATNRRTITTFKGTAKELKEFIKEGGFVEWTR